MSLLRLGLRLAVAGRKAGRVRAGLIAIGNAVGVLVLLFACAIPAVQARQSDQAAALQPQIAAGGSSLLYAEDAPASWHGRDLTVVQVAGTTSGLRPPGVGRLPGPGQAVVSPALGRQLREHPELARLVTGTVIGTIGQSGLVRPDDLRAYVGVVTSTPGLVGVSAFGVAQRTAAVSSLTDSASKRLDQRSGLTDSQRLLLAVLVFLGVPVLILLASAARLSAATRDRRLAALRLLGLTANQTRTVAAAEAATHAGVGAVLGAALFLLLRPLTQGVAVAGLSWFASDLTPGALLTTTILLGVPALTVAVALTPTCSMRPLLLRRAGTPRPPRLWRLLPLTAGIALLAVTASRSVTPAVGDSSLIPYFLLGTALAGLGVPLALPVLIRKLADALARRGGPTLRLTARRLQQEPATTTRVVAGLVVALFISAGAQAVLVAFERTPQYRAALRTQTTGPQYMEVEASSGVDVDAATLARVPGVTAVTAMTQAQSGCQPDGLLCVDAFIGRCAQLRHLMPALADCDDRTAAWLGGPPPGAPPPGRALTFTPWNADLPISQPRFTVPAPDQTWQLRETPVDSLDQRHYWAMFIPADTPGAADVVAAGRTLYSIQATGGDGPRDALTLAVAQLDPQAHVTSSVDVTELQQVMQYRSMLWAATAVALLLGFAALAITALDRAIERRRHLAGLHVIGAPAVLLGRVQVIQTIVPLLVGIPAAALTGLLAGRAYLNVGGAAGHTPTGSVLSTLALGVIATLVVGALTLPGVGTRVTPQMLRRE